MKNRKFKKVLLSSAITLIPLVTVLSCSDISSSGNFSESWIGDRKELVSHSYLASGNTTLKWFGTIPYSSTRHYSGFKDSDARLVSKWTDEKLDSTPNESKTRFRLKQAKAIDVTYIDADGNDVTHRFNNDAALTTIQKSESSNANNINSNKFKELLIHSKVKKFDFILRDNNYWVNHKGEKTKYEVTNKDFLRGLRINILHWISSYRYKVAGWSKSFATKELSEFENIINEKTLNDYFSFRDISNTYIFEMAGLPWENFFGLNEEGEFINGNQIAPNDDPKKVSFHFEGETQPTFWWDFFINDHNTAFSAVPAAYIDELPVDYYSLPRSNKLGSLGYYKYGRTFDEMLYAGAYYVSKNTPTIIEVKKNPYYVVADIRDNKNAILKFSTFISKVDAESSLPLQEYNRFKNGVQFFIGSSSFNLLPSSKKINLFKNHKDSIIRSQYFPIKQASHQLHWAMLPNITKSNKFLYDNNYNDAFRKVLFGKEKEELKNIDLNGTREVYKHMFTKSAVFKSLIHGAINWEQLMLNNNRSKSQYWPLIAAPGGVIKLRDSTKPVIDLYTKDDFTSLPMLKWDPIAKKPVSMGELSGKLNFDRLKTISNAVEVWKSHRYIEIERELKVLLDSIFGSGSSGVEIEFSLSLRYASIRAYDKIAYKFIAKALTDLNLGRYKIKIKEWKNVNDDRAKIRPVWSKWVLPNILGKGTSDYFGWNSDVSDVLGLILAGKVYMGSRRVHAGVQYLSYMASLDPNSDIAMTYPNVKSVADYYKTKYNNLVNSTEFQNKIKAIIQNNKANNKAYYSWSELKPKITTPFEKLVTHQNLSKTVNSKTNTFVDIVLGVVKNLKEDKINKIIADIGTIDFQAWIIGIQPNVLNYNESNIKGFIDEFSLLNGFNMQISGRPNEALGRNSNNSGILKTWLKMTQLRGGYVHLAEWNVKGV